jgi:hypothetical protein
MTDLAARIEQAYQRQTGADSPRGARAWFARRARVTPRHVSRILSGDAPLDGPLLSVLELLERPSD